MQLGLCDYHFFSIAESLDPDIVGIPEKVEPKNPLDDEILKKFLKPEDSIEEQEEEVFVLNYHFSLSRRSNCYIYTCVKWAQSYTVLIYYKAL